MATTIKTKNSTTAATAPTGLVQGELAVNITDKKLYVGDSVGNSIQIAGAGATNAAGGSNTQVQYNSSGALAGSSSFVFDGTNVGIGTSSPLSQLNVYKATTGGNIRISSNTDSAYGELIFSSSNATYAAYGASISSFGDGGGVDSGNLMFNTGQGGVRATKMTLTGTGNLGLGVTPSAWGGTSKALQFSTGGIEARTNNLSFVNNAYFDGTNWKYTNSLVASLYGLASNGQFQWYTAPVGTAGNTISFTQAMTLDASGNLGIGTSSPATKVQVSGSAAPVLRVTDTRNTVNLDMQPANTEAYFGTSSNHPLAFQTNATERMRIDSSGNLLIGTTSNSSSYRALLLGGSQPVLRCENTNTSDMIAIKGNSGGSSGSAMYVMPMRFGDDTLRGSIYWTGSAIQYNTSSDYRLKENIAPMTGALAKVAELKPCTYTWKESGIDSQGFIAHELQAVVPECVTGEKDAVETYIDEEGVEQTRPVYQGIDTSFLVATLTAAIQELKAEVDSLKAQLAK